MADFPIRVTINPAAAMRGARVVRRELSLVERGANRLRASLFSAFAVFAGGALILNGIKALAQFEQQMATVRAVTGATTETFAELTAAARELGANTRFSATQAAEGQLFLARAGFEVNEILSATPDILNLAAAGALELGEAADIASNVLSQFRLDVEELGRVNDTLVNTANSANTNITQLAEALKLVGPVAGALGKPIEEVAAALGTLGNNGLQGSLAGTNLRGVFGALIGPTDGAKEVLQRLAGAIGETTSAFDIQTRSVSEVFRSFKQAGAGAQDFFQIFGRRNIAAALILRDSADAVDELTRKVSEEGTTAKVATIQNDTLLGAFDQLKSAITEVTLAVGDSGLVQALRGTVDFLTAVVREMAGITEEGSKASFAVRLFANSLEASAKAGAAFAALALAKIGISIAASFGPAGIAVAALAVAFTLFEDDVVQSGNRAATVGEFLTAVFQVFGARSKIALEATGNAIGVVVTTMQELFEDASTIFGVLFDFVLNSARNVANASVASIKTAFDVIFILGKQVFGILKSISDIEFGTNFLSSAANAADGLKSIFDGRAVQDVFNKAGEQAGENFSKNYVGTAESAIANGVENLFGDLDVDKLSLDNIFAAFDVGQVVDEVTSVADGLRQVREAREAAFAADAEQKQLEERLIALGLLTNGVTESTESLTAAQQGLAFEIEDSLTKLDRFESGLKRQIEILGTAAQSGDGVERARFQVEVLAEAMVAFRGDTELANEELRRQLELFDQFELASTLQDALEPAQALESNMRLLSRAIEDTGDPTGQLARNFRDAKIAALELETDGLSGLERGLLKFQAAAEDTGAQLEGALTNAFGGIEDAFVDFTRTGELSFSKLADSIIADLTRILVKQLLLQALNAFLPGAGTAIGAVPAFAQGGSVLPNRQILVGERGPELFNPSTSGMIIPANQTAAALGSGQQAAPVVNVAPPQISLTLELPDNPDVATEIETPDGTRAVLNVIRKNPRGARA